ncbi:MAG: tetratricopeptide repeat protein, partial [Muribaculaceae bacterium]|nr:tetratricopeptide repeat protein [Muribaculaceae bacterium]
MITPFSSAGEIYAEALANFKAKKYEVAVVYFEKAWRKNPGVGDFVELAYCHMNGFGTPKNAARCFEIINVVAQRGNVVAQNNLGYLYYNGIGVEQNRAEGIRWFESAADKGYDEAKYTLAKIYHDKSSEKPGYAAKSRMYIKALAAKSYKDSADLLRQW